MKKNLFLILAMALPLLTFVACGGDDPVDPDTLGIEYTPSNVDAAGGTATFEVVSNISWTVANTDAWITNINPKNGEGTKTVTVTFAANTSATPRPSVFTVSAGTSLEDQVTITQNAASAPAAAGAITETDVTASSVVLNIAEISGAATYKWYKDGAEVQNTAARTYTATASGTYKVAGVNAAGEGTASADHVVTLTSVPAAAGAITETDVTAGSVVLNIAEISGAATYKWYKDGAEVQNTAARTYTATANGTYKVAGVNAAGEGTASANHVVTLQGESLNFTDIPAGTYAGSGTPDFLQTPGASSWSGQLVANSDASGNYYSITNFADRGMTVFVDYREGKLYIDNTYKLGATADKTLEAYFDAAYIAGEYIYTLTSYSPTFNKSTNTLDFSGKYEGNDVMVGVGAHAAADGPQSGIQGAFTDFYVNCKAVITPAPAPAASASAQGARAYSYSGREAAPSFSGTAVKLDGLKYGGTVQFDPAKFSKN